MISNDLVDMDKTLSSPFFFDFLKNIDVDSVLDLRDSHLFDTQWMIDFNRLKNESYNQEDLDFINILREKSFKLSFEVIKNHEIASRISDDIEIIAKDILQRSHGDWPAKYLWESYKNKKFPD
ncbi:hypothetical protein JHU04_001247 [Brenneria sp. 4F2]|nr:hypothetical protein [Brenneria bubanii]